MDAEELGNLLVTALQEEPQMGGSMGLIKESTSEVFSLTCTDVEDNTYRVTVERIGWPTSVGVSLTKACIGCNGAEIMNGHRRECPDYVQEGSWYSV